MRHYTHRELAAGIFSRTISAKYYAQLNFTDNFSARIGKQQIIWSEADALSGTEVTNVSYSAREWHGGLRVGIGGRRAAPTCAYDQAQLQSCPTGTCLHTREHELEGFIYPRATIQGPGPILSHD